eukprot:5602370-Alexandrium_andersonii.AAC.1
MSASLVGSEMCIRDSPPNGGPAQATSQARASVRAKAQEPVAAQTQAPACLLYTSDAADDM